MWNYLNSTRFKIKIANLIYLILKTLHFRNHRIILRNGVFYEIDISEGIDLSLFLFGNFQKNVTKNTLFRLSEDAVIFFFFSNIGSVSLYLAYKYPQSEIFAFEPTDYAYAKLQRNIQLNASLKDRIKPIQAFISSEDKKYDRREVFSSWRIDIINENRHPIHLGIAKKATEKHTTIDKFVKNNTISKLDFIKIDTDGNELEVLKGATDSLNNFHPIIVFELSTYILKENRQTFTDFEQILIPIGYNLIDAKSGIKVTDLNIDRIVPKAGSADIIALPKTL